MRSVGPSPVRKGECPDQQGGRGFCRDPGIGRKANSHRVTTVLPPAMGGGEETSRERREEGERNGGKAG